MRNLISMQIIFTFVLSTMFTGCADKESVEFAERMVAAQEMQNAYANMPANVRMLYEHEAQSDPLTLSKSDLLFMAHNAKHKKSDFEYARRAFNDHRNGYAYANRKLALAMARGLWSYKFSNYFYFDGVSGLTYNVAYLATVPAKALTGLRSSDGIFGYISDLLKLILGALAAIIGIFAATILNTFCHPLQTFANLTIGIFYFESGWFSYVFNTNIVASLWDLVWGGVVYPIWQALVFWL